MLVLTIVGWSFAAEEFQCTPKSHEDMIVQFENCGLPSNAKPEEVIPTETCFKNMHDKIFESISDLYPEGKRVEETLIKEKISFTPKEDTTGYITFVQTGAGYKNKLNLYYFDEKCELVEEEIRVFPYVNSFGTPCLAQGDTAVIRNLKGGRKYGFVLTPNYWDSPKQKIYSDITMGEACGADLKPQGKKPLVTWVEVRSNVDDFRSILFGFEDKATNSDYDYNDIMFTLHVDGCINEPDEDGFSCYEDLPSYDDVVDECIELETVTSSSYVEKDCYAWALLEKEEANACNFYLKPPKGWKIASYDDRSIIKDIAKWHRHEIPEKNCFGLLNGDKIEFYRHTSGDSYAQCDVDVKIYEDDEGCIAVHCDYRVILKSENSLNGGDECDDTYDFCEPGVSKVSSTYPYKDNNWITFPNIINTFMVDNDDLETSIKVRYNPSVDIVVAFDLQSLSSDQLETIRENFGNVFNKLDVDHGDLNYRVAAAGVHSNVLSVTNFATSIDPILPQLNDIITKKFGSGSLMNLVKVSSACDQCAWREDSSTVRVIVFVTNREPTAVDDQDIKTVLDNNNIMVFVSGKGNGNGWKSFHENFKNSASQRINDVHKDYYKHIGKLVKDVIKYSHIHIVEGDSAIDFNGAPRTIDLGGTEKEHTFTIKYQHTVKEVLMNTFGRSTTKININVNRPPIAQDASVSFTLTDDDSIEISLALIANDPDSSRLRFRVENDGGLEVEARDVDDDGWFENPNIKILIDNSDPIQPDYKTRLKFTVSDGCASADLYVNVFAECDTDVENPNHICFVPKCHPNQAVTVTKGKEAQINLSGFYSENYDGEIRRKVKKITGPQNSVFYDSSEDYIEEGDEVDATIFFKSDNVYSSNDEYILSYTVYNGALEGEDDDIPTSECSVHVYVEPSFEPPVYIGQTVFDMDEDSFLTFFIDDKKIDFEVPLVVDGNRIRVYIEPDQSGKLCNNDGEVNCISCCRGTSCSATECMDSESTVFPTFSFRPRANDYGQNYFTIPITLIDSMIDNAEEGQVTITINVNPVNDAPVIEVDEDVKLLRNNEVNVINKGEEFVFSWRVRDIDNLPRDLRTIVGAQAYTRNPWEALACVDGEDECSQLIEPAETISYNIIETKDCSNAQALKEKYGDLSQLEECYAEFKLRFIPQNHQSPYIVFTLTGYDQQEFNGLSVSERVQVNVNPVNLPPVVWSPPEIESTTSLVNIRDGQETVNVTDDAPAFWEIDLTMTSISENGHFVIPSIASSKCQEDEYSVVCKDTVMSINNWIKELRYNITDGSKEAELAFIAHDNGYPGLPNSKSEPSNEVRTLITISDSIVEVPKSSSKLLIIALSVGAAGAIAIGIAVAVLRNKLSPPSDDYFQIGTDTVSTSPQSPLYVGQTKEGFSGLYSGGRA